MLFYFVRHGESTANVENIISNRGFQHPLTQLGLEQAENLATTLKNVIITHIYTSPLQRAVQTAALIAKAKNLDVTIEEALREFDCGVLEGRDDDESWAQLRNVWTQWLGNHNLNASLPEGESFNDIINRFIPFVEALAQKHHPDDTVVLVAHGGIYLAGLPVLLNNIDHNYAISQRIGNAQYIKVLRTEESFTCLEWCGQSIT